MEIQVEADQLQRALEAVRLTDTELAERLEVSPSTLQAYRQGRQKMPPSAQFRVASVIKAHAAELERMAKSFESPAVPDWSEPAPSPPPAAALLEAPRAGVSKAKIVWGALGLLAFIVGVRQIPTGSRSGSDGER
jgi:transcriptional regulator with XRE-family HTH domain